MISVVLQYCGFLMGVWLYSVSYGMERARPLDTFHRKSEKVSNGRYGLVCYCLFYSGIPSVLSNEM